jgi:hypothetical protein
MEILFNKRHFSLVFAVAFFGLSASALLAEAADAQLASGQSEIISKYLEAAGHSRPTQDESSEVEISASIPKLKKQGHLRALRQMSKLGQVTYRVLGFQGDGSVKREVISRYLEAEQQTHKQSNMGLTPANYRFRLKGERNEAGRDVYVFQVSPRKKRVGLFKGEVWLDAASYLPVYEKGRLAKNPSIFFKKVDFERAYEIRNGANVPQHLSSTIDTRIVGKVEVEVNFSNPPASVSSPPQTAPVSALARAGY